MNISCMTISIPIDVDTLEEIKELIQITMLEDELNYTSILSVDELTDYHLRGLCVLAYDDDTDKLVGILSAVDRIATLDFEWSAVVLPSARRKGIGEQLVMELTRNLELRGAGSDLALVPEKAEAGKLMLKKLGYIHQFSERTMAANAEKNELTSKIEISPYSTINESDIIEVLVSAFGDTVEEARELIAFNIQSPNRRLMQVTVEDEIVGTVSIVDDAEKLWVTALAVHEKARGKGIASTILNWSKNEAYRLEKPCVYLDVETDNEDALSVYKRAGFKTVHHTNFYKKG